MKKKLTYQELLDLTVKICDHRYKTEGHRYQLVRLLERNVPHPEVSDLIFYHKPRLTPEEILEKALAYKPIIMSGPVYTEEELKNKNR